jgi:hypothetical protein
VTRTLATVLPVALAAALLGPSPRARAGGPQLQSFASRPDLRPPAVRVRVHRPGAAQGKILVTPKAGPGDAGPMMLDGRGRMLWFRDLPGELKAFNFRAQRYRGKPVLTWFQGYVTGSYGTGVDVIADRHYRVIQKVQAGHGLKADLHEFLLTPRGTAYLTAYRPVTRNLRAVGGPRRGTVAESVVQEVDVRSGKVLWQWSSLKHVKITDAYGGAPLRNPYFDYFHVNSIQELPNRNLLISARVTGAVYLIDHRSGKVIWQLGGKASDFAMGKGATFRGQHDAHMLADGRIALFDNGFPPGPDYPSRVIVLRLDLLGMTAQLVRDYEHPTRPESHSQGGDDFLPNGNVFVGWGGDTPWFSELAPSGRRVFDARFVPRLTNTYRAFRQPWTGSPAEPPRAAAHTPRSGSGETVYASWNGATRAFSWRVLAGSRPGSLHPVARSPRRGFETAIRLKLARPWVAVEAIGPGGRVLRRSAPAAAVTRP